MDTVKTANIQRFTGFADKYDKFRPSPPSVIVDILTQLALTSTPNLVVDIGCGTGLSTRIWSSRAKKIIGVEPSNDMRSIAESQSKGDSTIHYQPGFSTATALPDSCADIVVISQALHWMDPIPTFTEVVRILRPGGIFAAIDHDWPPTFNLEAEACFREYFSRIESLFNEKKTRKGR